MDQSELRLKSCARMFGLSRCILNGRHPNIQHSVLIAEQNRPRNSSEILLRRRRTAAGEEPPRDKHTCFIKMTLVKTHRSFAKSTGSEPGRFGSPLRRRRAAAGQNSRGTYLFRQNDLGEQRWFAKPRRQVRLPCNSR